MKYFFPLHFDGGNRGCEGISKGTAKILGLPPKNLIAYSRDVVLDTWLGMADNMTLVKQKPLSLISRVSKKIETMFSAKAKAVRILTRYQYGDFLDSITPDDVMVSTGGDMLCYKNNMVNETNNILHDRGVKTILWGCSMGEVNYTKEKFESLKKFSLIYARESLTYNYFESLGLENVVCLPDPAFVLEPEKIELPDFFKKEKIIGINVSPYVLKLHNSTVSSTFGHSFLEFLEYIFSKTEYSILFVPHVLWPKQDDRVSINFLCNYLKNWNNRIFVLDSNRLNYLQIRYVISNCEYFIGARTHAVISAYSTCIPTIALGYSVKSKGIAKDLELEDALLIDTTNNNEKTDIIDSFKYLESNNDAIRKHLSQIMPEYRLRPYKIKDSLSKLGLG